MIFEGKEYKVEVGTIKSIYTPAKIGEEFKDNIQYSTENRVELKKYLKDDYIPFCEWVDMKINLYKEIK